MKLNWLEKITLMTLGASVAYKMLVWQVGMHTDTPDTTPFLFGLLTFSFVRELFGWVGFVGFDLVVLSTVLNMRRTGPNADGMAALLAAATSAALIGLEINHVISAPALYGVSAIVLLVFGLHLAFDGWRQQQPVHAAERSALVAEQQRLETERSALASARAEAETERQRLETERAAFNQTEAAQHASAWRTRAEQFGLNAAQWEARAKQLADELETLRTRPALPEPSDETMIEVAGRSYSLRQLAKIVNVSPSTLAGWLKQGGKNE